jgi:hypothetical protein
MRARFVALTLLSATLGAASAAAGDHAALAEILAGSRRARIMEGSVRPSTRVEHWSISAGGLDGTRDIVRSGSDFREDTVLGPLREARGMFHHARWLQDPNGMTLLLSGIHRRDEISRDALAAATTGARYVRLIGEVLDPKPAYVVEVNPPSGRHEYLFYDKTTLLLIRMEAALPDVRLVTAYDDFRTTSGLTEPWHVHSSDGRPFNDADEKLETLAVGGPVDVGALAIPPDRRRLLETPGPNVTLPAKIVADRVIVAVKIDKHTINLQLDSGASGIVVDRSVLDALQVKTYGRTTGATAGEYVETQAILPDMAIGPVHMRDVVVDSIPFTQWSGDGTPVAGLLGFDFIDGAVVHVDYLHGTVDLIEGSSFVPPPDAKSAPIVLDDGVPFLSVRVGDAVGEHFVVDTGADRSLLTSSFVASHPREVADQGLGQAMTASFPFVGGASGVGGRVSIRPTQVRSIGIAGITLPNWLFFATENAKSFEGEDMDGLVGQDFLRNFDLYLDYRRARIYLQPNARFRARWPSLAG